MDVTTSPPCAFTRSAVGGTGTSQRTQNREEGKEGKWEREVGGRRGRGNLLFLPEPLVALLCSYSVAPSFKGFSLLIAIVHY